MLKSAQQHFYPNFPLMQNKVSCLSCLLVGSELWGPSFNTLTTDHMYFCHNKQKFRQQVPTHLSSKHKTRPGLIIAYFKCPKNFKDFEKKITFIPSIFQQLLIPKNVVP